jgi:hypothetical protein
MLNPPHRVQGPPVVATPVRAADPSVVPIARHRGIAGTHSARCRDLRNGHRPPPPRAQDDGSSDASEDNRSPRLARPSLPDRLRALVKGSVHDVDERRKRRFRAVPARRCRTPVGAHHPRSVEPMLATSSPRETSAEERCKRGEPQPVRQSTTSRIALAFRSSRAVPRRRWCGPPPGNCGGSSVAARLKMRHSTGMPSVLHSNPLDREIVDMYVTVLTPETDLALTADRKAPSLGLQSPNENIRGLKTVSSDSTADGTHCRVKTDISIATRGKAPQHRPYHLSSLGLLQPPNAFHAAHKAARAHSASTALPASHSS